jgi:3-isopropylmalate/(R)-2-methylmalate dehydratase small subunit
VRFLPTISPSSGPRLVRHAGIAAQLSPGVVKHSGATILLAAETFGIEGFTRTEGNLPASGVRVLIAPGFGSEFFSEAVRQGILLVALPNEVIDGIIAWVEANPQQAMTVDLEAQLIDIPGMGRIPFETPPRVRHKLLHGLDDLDELIQHREDAVAFRMEDRKRRPWLYAGGAPGLGSGDPE